MELKKSLVVYLGKEDSGSSCGYCRSKNGFKSWGMWTYQMTNEDYQDLIDRGFRRSGKYVYKSEMAETCCPLYTIRNRVADFRPSPAHRRLLRQVARFLNTGERPRGRRPTADPPGPDTSAAGDQAPAPAPASGPRADAADGPKTGSGDGGAGTKSKEQKAKFKRWQRKLARMRARVETEGKSFDDLMEAYRQRRQRRLDKHREKTLEELLALVRPDAKHRLTCKLVRTAPKSEEFKATFDDEHRVYAKYQINIHGDCPSDCDRQQFKRFLVDSPLTESAGLLPSGYGSFHYQYWLDDRLIGVSVLDFLPRCLSSVYFFYDTDFEFLSLGTYSALREIAYTRELCAVDPALQYYYLGFYVHECRKMRYKGQYAASDLLCPETYSWHPIGACRPMLDRSKYSRLCLDPARKDEGRGTPDMCTVLLDGALMPWSIFRTLQDVRRRGRGSRARGDDDDKTAEYTSLVGAQCARRMILLIN